MLRNTLAKSRRASLRIEELEARDLMAADIVTEWDNRFIQIVRNDTTSPGPTWATRNAAMLHLAMFDAINAISQEYTSYVTTEKAGPTVSPEAAAATVAHDILVALYPGQHSLIDVYYNADLAAVPNGPGENAGVSLGHRVAQEYLWLRSTDKATSSPGTYTTTLGPGHWSPDPLNPAQTALGAQWGKVTPFGIDSAATYQVPPPPLMTSAEYATAYNEVKSLGAKNSVTRTADQTQQGIFWAYDAGGIGPPSHIYNQAVQVISAQQNLSLTANARLFALVNMAMADTTISVWNTKYTYDFWRPIDGIRQGELDGNAATIGDPTWVPLGAPGFGTGSDFTPPFPAYTSGHAGMGAAAFHTLAQLFGNNYNFSLKSDELPGVTRNFTSFSQAAQENGRSRIYLGIHWEFDNVQGQIQGNQISEYLVKNFLKPRSGGAAVGLQIVGQGYHSVPVGDNADVTLRKSGDNLQFFNNKTAQVILQEKLANVIGARFDGANGTSDILTVDFNFGGNFTFKDPLWVTGGVGDIDRLVVVGTAANDSLTLKDNSIVANGLKIGLDDDVRYVAFTSLGGNDTPEVGRWQTDRIVDLLGGEGNDTFQVHNWNGQVGIFDAVGIDLLSFEKADYGVNVDLSFMLGRPQNVGGGSIVRIVGAIENLDGSQCNDTLRGNALNNKIRGLAGNDFLDGRAGNDILGGGDGNDIILGGDGEDTILGRAGRDLLIGGKGIDKLDGGAGDDIVIGGSTTFDSNEAALLACMKEWTSSRNYITRKNNLTGIGIGPRANGNFFLKDGVTVIDDLESDIFSTATDIDLWFKKVNDATGPKLA